MIFIWLVGLSMTFSSASTIIIHQVNGPQAVLFKTAPKIGNQQMFLYEGAQLAIPPLPSVVKMAPMQYQYYLSHAGRVAARDASGVITLGDKQDRSVYVFPSEIITQQTDITRLNPSSIDRARVTLEQAEKLKAFLTADNVAAYQHLNTVMDGSKNINEPILRTRPVDVQSNIDLRESVPFKDRFAFIAGGQYIMGSPKSENGRFSNEIESQKTVKSFFAQKWLVTEEEWDEIMGFGNASQRKRSGSEHGLNFPVRYISLYDAYDFANKRSERDGLVPVYEILRPERNKTTGSIEFAYVTKIAGYNGYRLLLDEEWEYAARAGTKTAHPFPIDRIHDFVFRQNGESDPMVAVIGTKLPNPWGLFDMFGLLYQWVERVNQAERAFIRGGCYNLTDSRYLRSAHRGSAVAKEMFSHIGLRLGRNADN